MKKVLKGLVIIMVIATVLGAGFAGGCYAHSHNLLDKYRIQKYVDLWNEEGITIGGNRTRALMEYSKYDHRYYFVIKEFDEYGKNVNTFMYDMGDIKNFREEERP